MRLKSFILEKRGGETRPQKESRRRLWSAGRSGGSMEHALEIRTLSDARFLSVVRATTGQIAQVIGFGSREVEQIKLAVDEICANIIRHTYKGDPNQKIILAFTVLETGLEIQIRDFGKKVDPRVLEHPKTRRSKPGGFGLFLIRSVIDRIEFGAATTVGNTYRLVKYKQMREA